MGQPTSRMVEGISTAHTEAVNRILEHIPPAQRPEALRICRQLIERCGTNAPDALRGFSAIVSSERFIPSMLGTVALIASRAGPDPVHAITAFERLLSSERFNRNVHEAARLSIVRAGPDSSEALRALYFLVENPSFSARSLDLALPDRFVRFLDAAIRAGGPEAYMSIRCMGSMFCNPAFTPSDLTARSADSFARMIRQARTDTVARSLDTLEVLSTVLANSAIDPHALGHDAIANLIRMTGAVSLNFGQQDSSYEDSLRLFRLIVGNRHFNLDMVAEGGLFSTFITASPNRLSVFLDFMRAVRRSPHILEIATEIAGSQNAADSMRLLVAISENPALSPFLLREDAGRRIMAVSAALRRCNNVPAEDLEGAGRIPSAMFLLASIVRDERVTLHGFQRLLSLCNALDTQADVGLLMVHEYLMRAPDASDVPASRPGGGAPVLPRRREFPSDDELAAIPAFISLAGSGLPSPSPENARTIDNQTPPWHRLSHSLGVIARTRNFNFAMVRDGGLLPLVLERCNPDDVPPVLSRLMVTLDDQAFTPGLEQFLTIIIRPIRRADANSHWNVFRTLNVFYDMAGSMQDEGRILPTIISAVRNNPALTDSVMSIYTTLLRTHSFDALLRTPAFAQRVVRLLAGAGRREDRARFTREFERLASAGSTFTPEIFARVERMVRIAGPLSGNVLHAVNVAHTHTDRLPGQSLATMLSSENISFIIAMVRAAPANSRQDVAFAVGKAFQDLSGRRTGQEIALQHRLLECFTAFIHGAGDQAGGLAQVFPAAMESVFSRQRINPAQVLLLSPETARRYGEWSRTYLSSVPAAHRSRAVDSLSLLFGTILQDERFSTLLLERPQSFQAGRALAERLTGGFVTPEVAMNFALAIETIGVQRATVLYQRFGIQHFARYPTEVLLRQYERSMGRSTRPTVLAIFPDYDYNGAFYPAGERLGDLSGRFDTIIYERGTENGFYHAAADFRRNFGRTGNLIIAGHGSPESVRLGEDSDEGRLDISDEARITALREVLLPGSSTVLVSCSTGRDEHSIGALFSRLLGSTLYAPIVPSNISRFGIAGEHISASFFDASSVFSAGRRAGQSK